MAAAHPYISGPGNIALMVNNLRSSFPATITSETVKRLGIAPNNESYVINALVFVGIIDGEGKKTKEAADVFSHHRDEDFAQAFSELVKSGYKDLFDLYGDPAWEKDKDALITFFRRADGTSAAIGARQAGTFQVFAALSGHGELPTRQKPTERKAAPKGSREDKRQKRNPEAKSIKLAPVAQPEQASTTDNGYNPKKDWALTVRVEVNLPADASAETYDNIFRSIRANLMND
ncbi:DUF5343 domain-containing protein [Aquibium sp. A9E412]|uniref:DUF5343 domain-containing protein n=1 Tax=Aquibium sp. A9E412 TaxID=2976767 RepID=UPI0025AEDB21|nr:DUF5343 domain-containing protein [Aquibium sp. A9E412]MDN2565373.1 DUF5343 domain-containing protein [Aquibium sp. A9E412]